MKKLLLIFAYIISIKYASAENTLSVSNINIPQGGESFIEINCDFNLQFKGYQLDVELDKGLSLITDEEGKPIGENGFTGTDHSISSTKLSEDKYRFVVVSITGHLLPTNGTLLRLKVSSSDSISVGNKYNCQLTSIEFTTNETKTYIFNDVPFTISITQPADPWITLDETSTTIPEASDGETDIKVKRSIKANEWSTICLPFALSEAQVYDVFGEDVQLVEFMEYETDDKLNEINVIFDDALLAEDGFMANYPYLIKTSKDITEFIVTSTIESDEENAFAEFTNGKTGSRKEIYGTFHGTLCSGKTIPNNCLFINSNKFWYSTGKTPIMGFRGYFDFVDILSNKTEASSRMRVIINGEETNITSILNKEENNDWFTLQGLKISKPTKRGIYIKDGKKYFLNN